MGFFKKKKEADETIALLRRLDKRGITSFAERDPQTYRETILGRSGAFSVADNELIISCENKIHFCTAPVGYCSIHSSYPGRHPN